MMFLQKINRNHRIERIVWYIVSLILHPFLKIRKGRVLFVAYGGNQYSCNPRAISEYILSKCEDFEVVWLFTKNHIPEEINPRIKIVEYLTIKAVLAINTSEFVVTNKRTDPWIFAWKKKKGQKYIMTWHGGRPLKKVELDAIDSLGPSYLKRMKNDSAYCDLFLSESRYTSNLYHNAFLYDGEILEKGIPRNDIFFDVKQHAQIKKNVFNHFGIDRDFKVVLYAPTFRKNKNLDCYNIDWLNIIPALEKLLEGRVKVLIRLHPNFLGSSVDRSLLFSNENLLEATTYNNFNDLIIASDMMISDYSSCMFDFAFTKRPCFIYAVDSEKYERGFYMNLRDLPFPFAEDNEQLLCNILNFNIKAYQSSLQKCMDNMFGTFDTGHATKAVVDWMIERRLKC